MVDLGFNYRGCEVERFDIEPIMLMNFKTGHLDYFCHFFPVIRPKFVIGQEVVWDSLFGTFGRRCGSGIIKEINNCLYLVTIDKARSLFRWFREFDLLGVSYSRLTFWLNEKDGCDESDGLSPGSAWRSSGKMLRALGRDNL